MRYCNLIALGIGSIIALACFESPGLAQKGKLPPPRPQPKVNPNPKTFAPPKNITQPKDSVVHKDLRVQDTDKRVADKARLVTQNNREIRSREDANVALRKQAVEHNQTLAKNRQELNQSLADHIAKLPAGDKERFERMFQNQGAVRARLQNQSLARMKGVRANGNVLKGNLQTQTVSPKENTVLLSKVAGYHNTAAKMGVELDGMGRIRGRPNVQSLTASPGGASLWDGLMSGNISAISQANFTNAASMWSGGLPFLGTSQPGTPFSFQPGTPFSALAIPPADGSSFGGSSVPGFVPNVGAVVIPNSTDGVMPSAVTPGVIPSLGGIGGYQIVQTLPSIPTTTMASSDTESQEGPSDVLVAEGTEAAASIRQATRFVRFTNATDKKALFYIHYETIDAEGNSMWLPPKEDGYMYATSVEVAPGESVDLKEGEWRVNATRARIWAVSEGREWLRYKGIDLWLVPEVDEDGNHSYQAPNPETYSYTIA